MFLTYRCHKYVVYTYYWLLANLFTLRVRSWYESVDADDVWPLLSPQW
jgi:hypothetical protein